MTAKKLAHGERTTMATYVVCLDCGKEFPYDWQQMKVIAPGKSEQHSAA